MPSEAQSRLFQETDRHLMEDPAPSRFLRSIEDASQMRQYPFSLLRRTRFTDQSPHHHPEGNVWNHTLLVVDEAAKVKEQSQWPRAFLWAALLHDIGKPPTTKQRKGRITSYGHDKAGAGLADEFLLFFHCDRPFIRQVRALVRYHMQILFVVNGLPYADMEGMTRSVDVREIALLGMCDRLGRGAADVRAEQKNIAAFLEKCGRYTAPPQ